MTTKTGITRDYYDEAKRNLLKQVPSLQGVQFDSVEFSDTSIDSHSNSLIIYCDPPYADTTGYSTGLFDHVDFWNTIRHYSKHNFVFVSEENAPDDFVCIWEQEIKRTVDNNKRTQSIEKLYVMNGSSSHKWYVDSAFN